MNIDTSIKIALFDVGFSDECYNFENPQKYGGGGVIGRHFKQFDNFHLYAPAKSLSTLGGKDRMENVFPMSDELYKALQLGYPIDKLFDLDKYDVILHGHTCFTLNRTREFNKPIVHWSAFSGTAGHPLNNYILLYRKCFVPCFGEKAKYVKIGKPIPKIFEEFNNRDGIFQCTQHCQDFDTINIAKQCIENKITARFAGPIRDYPLMDYIDNKYTFYLGIIPEKEKLEYTQKARLYSLPLKWDVVFNQSAIEANGLGTPILAYPNGWFKEYIVDGINGFFYNGENLVDFYKKAANISQLKCWESAKSFDIDEVTRTFYQAFSEIKNEWSYKTN